METTHPELTQKGISIPTTEPDITDELGSDGTASDSPCPTVNSSSATVTPPSAPLEATKCSPEDGSHASSAAASPSDKAPENDEVPQQEPFDHPIQRRELENQWITLPPGGIIRYERTFLVQMQSQPLSLKMPQGLPDSVMIKNTVKSTKVCEPKPADVPTDMQRNPGYVQEGNPGYVRSTTLLTVLYDQVQGILNQKKQKKFPKLAEQVHKLPINTENELEGVLQLVMHKAIDDPSKSVKCANVCKCLSLMKIPSDNTKDGCADFQSLLRRKCKMKLDLKYRAKYQYLKKIDAVESEEMKTKLEEACLEERQKVQQRCLGSVRFVSELFKLKMVTAHDIGGYLERLLKQKDDTSFERLCCLLTSIGKLMDADKSDDEPNGNKIMDGCFEQMHEIVDKKKLSASVRFMLQDMFELRLNKWQRRKPKDAHKTVQKPCREIKDERLQKGSQPASLRPPDAGEIWRKNLVVALGNNPATQGSVGEAGCGHAEISSGLGDPKLKSSTENNNSEEKEFPVDMGLNSSNKEAIIPTSASCVIPTSSETFTSVSEQSVVEVTGNNQTPLCTAPQGTSLDEALLQETNGLDSQLNSKRERLKLFAKYVVDLFKDVAEDDCRKCQFDVVKVMNGYATGRTVEVDIV